MPTMIDGRGDEIKILHDGPGTEDGGGSGGGELLRVTLGCFDIPKYLRVLSGHRPTSSSGRGSTRCLKSNPTVRNPNLGYVRWRDKGFG